MKTESENYCSVCGEDDGMPHSLYEHVLSVLEDNATRLTQKERETVASTLVGELKAPRVFLDGGQVSVWQQVQS